MNTRTHSKISFDNTRFHSFNSLGLKCSIVSDGQVAHLETFVASAPGRPQVEGQTDIVSPDTVR